MADVKNESVEPIVISIDDERTRDRSRSPINRNSEKKSGDESESHQSNIDKKNICKNKRLFISNIPYEMRWQALKDLFKKEVGDVNYVNLPEDSNGKPLGSGLIEFKDVETAQAAINKMDRFEIKGRKIIVREETEKDKRHLQKLKEKRRDRDNSFSKQNIQYDSVNSKVDTSGITPQVLQNLGIDGPVIDKIFVANLDYKVNTKKLREVFQLAGKIVSLELMEDKDGKSRGMGTVRYETALEACQAISMFNKQMLYDRIMTVKMDKLAEPIPNSKRLPSGLKGIGQPLNSATLRSAEINPGINDSYNSHIRSPIESNINSLRFSSSLESPNNSINPTTLLSSFTGRTNILANLGRSDFLKSTNSGNGSYYDLYRDEYMAHKNKELDMYDIRDSVSRDRSYGNNSNMTRGQQRDDFGDSRMSDNTNSVFVRNLSYKTTWQDLKERFRQCGDVRFAEIKTENGRSKGCGVVRFHSHDSARRAIEKFDGMELDGRRIEVRYDRMP